MKIKLESDEWYPYYTVSRGRFVDVEIELTGEELAWVERSLDIADQVQSFLCDKVYEVENEDNNS